MENTQTTQYFGGNAFIKDNKGTRRQKKKPTYLFIHRAFERFYKSEHSSPSPNHTHLSLVSFHPFRPPGPQPTNPYNTENLWVPERCTSCPSQEGLEIHTVRESSVQIPSLHISFLLVLHLTLLEGFTDNHCHTYLYINAAACKAPRSQLQLRLQLSCPVAAKVRLTASLLPAQVYHQLYMLPYSDMVTSDSFPLIYGCCMNYQSL